MDATVNTATMADLDALVESWIALVESQRAFGSHIAGESNRTVARHLLAEYVDAGMVAVARAEAELQGFVMFYEETGTYEQTVRRGVVENIYVRPEGRGAGIGSALLDHAEAALADRGIEVVSIAAMAENDSAIDLYEGRKYSPYRIVFERPLDEGESVNESPPK
ncbi:MAG: GNAT family N-acetyltransferase [Halodesulfurarchaeum sp.]